MWRWLRRHLGPTLVFLALAALWTFIVVSQRSGEKSREEIRTQVTYVTKIANALQAQVELLCQNEGPNCQPVITVPSSIPSDDKATPGPQGPQGPPGDQGNPGPPGAEGSVGPIGGLGPQGDKGDTGATGATGAEGPQGPEGPMGPEGPAGPQGPAGEPGAVGPQGPPGPEGPPGPQGEQGPPGNSPTQFRCTPTETALVLTCVAIG